VCIRCHITEEGCHIELTKDAKYPLRPLSPDDGHYFFGYYDLQPYSADGLRHLCHRVDLIDRLPLPGDTAELGFLESGKFHAVAQTKAWNFQQGAMLQCAGGSSILYNIFENGAFSCAIHDLATGRIRTLSLPLATVNLKSGLGLSINFSRVYDFRPGYGYACLPDPFAGVNAPAEDGVFFVDLNTGAARQIISYRDLAESFPQAPYTTRCKIIVNHITFNPSGDRFIFLLRNFPTGDIPWITSLFASDLDGNVKKLTNFCFNSHYNWKNDEELLIESDHLGKTGLHLFDVESGEAKFMDAPEMNSHGIHILYSPDRRYLLGDRYPDGDNYRALYLHDVGGNKSTLLAKVYSPPDISGDIRCDLHARWGPDGKFVSFDTTHNGRRGIYEMDLRGLEI